MSDQYYCPVPVLFLVFNRPDLAQISFERIRAVRPPRLYIHCDGARTDRAGEAERVALSRQIADSVDWPCEVFTLYRDQNAGLRKALSGAITWFFEHESAGIIMEDDCLADPSFFRFCSELLEQYADDEAVMHIGAWNLIEAQTKTLQEAYFWSSFSIVTAFATWRRAWEKMDLSMAELDDYERSGQVKQLVDLAPAQAYMLDKFRVTQALKNRSWAYSWFYSILINNGLCILSTKNLIQNIGFGDEATNTTNRNTASEIGASSVVFPLIHPKNRSIDKARERQLFYAYQKRPIRLWAWYFLHLIGLR